MSDNESGCEITLDRHPHARWCSERERTIEQHIEDLLDAALEETFPASDPPSIAVPHDE